MSAATAEAAASVSADSVSAATAASAAAAPLRGDDVSVKTFRYGAAAAAGPAEGAAASTAGHDPQPPDSVTVRIVEHSSAALGSFVWPSANLLNEYIWATRAEWKGKKVLELGCGRSLCGLLCALLGAEVTLSDADPTVLADARRSCELNGVGARCQVVSLPWGEFPSHVLSLPTFDVIVAADVFYDSKDYDDLFATLFYFSLPVLLAYQHRSVDNTRLLLAGLRKWHLRISSVSLPTSASEPSALLATSSAAASSASGVECELFELRPL